jgi:hypothetical protein
MNDFLLLIFPFLREKTEDVKLKIKKVASIMNMVFIGFLEKKWG